jgi:hypothetical protein
LLPGRDRLHGKARLAFGFALNLLMLPLLRAASHGAGALDQVMMAAAACAAVVVLLPVFLWGGDVQRMIAVGLLVSPLLFLAAALL